MKDIKQAIALLDSGLITRPEFLIMAQRVLNRLEVEWMGVDTLEGVARIERQINYTKGLMSPSRGVKPYTGTSLSSIEIL